MVRMVREKSSWPLSTQSLYISIPRHPWVSSLYVYSRKVPTSELHHSSLILNLQEVVCHGFGGHLGQKPY